MKHKELNETRRLITKVLAKPGMGPDQRDRLQKAKREFDKIAKSGKLDLGRIFRATESVAAVLLEMSEAGGVVR